MRIAHWSLFAPNQSGLYHTTKDTVLAQRAAGIDCALIDATDGMAKTDGHFATESWHYADTADVYVMHLAIPEPYYSDGTPQVILLHGAPLYSMQTELYGLEDGNPSPWSTILRYFARTDPTLYVSMWEREQGAYWNALDAGRGRMRYVPRGMDAAGNGLSPDGLARTLTGSPAIVIADQFRYFKDAIPSLYGALEYWRQNPAARVHLFGLPAKGHRARDTIDRWIEGGDLRHCIGSVNGIVDYLPEVFRGADVLLTTVHGESRVVLEALGCGCPVVGPLAEATARCDRFWEPERVASAIRYVLASAPSRAAIAAGIGSAYPMTATVAALKSVYEELAG